MKLFPVKMLINHPMWQKDIYPAPEELNNAIEEGELYVGHLGDRIAAAMVLNQKCNPEYVEALVAHGKQEHFARLGELKKEFVLDTIIEKFEA